MVNYSNPLVHGNLVVTLEKTIKLTDGIKRIVNRFSNTFVHDDETDCIEISLFLVSGAMEHIKEANLTKEDKELDKELTLKRRVDTACHS